MHGGELYGDARRLRGLLMGVRAHCNSPGQLVDETCSMYFICNLLQTFCRKIIGQGQVADCNSKYISYKLMSFQDVLSGKP